MLIIGDAISTNFNEVSGVRHVGTNICRIVPLLLYERLERLEKSIMERTPR